MQHRAIQISSAQKKNSKKLTSEEIWIGIWGINCSRNISENIFLGKWSRFHGSIIDCNYSISDCSDTTLNLSNHKRLSRGIMTQSVCEQFSVRWKEEKALIVIARLSFMEEKEIKSRILWSISSKWKNEKKMLMKRKLSNRIQPISKIQ